VIPPRMPTPPSEGHGTDGKYHETTIPHEEWCHHDMDCCGCTCYDDYQARAGHLKPGTRVIVHELNGGYLVTPVEEPDV
jgi:hypothetical protein